MRILSRTHQHTNVLHASLSRSRAHTYLRARWTLGQSVLKHLATLSSTYTLRDAQREGRCERGRDGQEAGRKAGGEAAGGLGGRRGNTFSLSNRLVVRKGRRSRRRRGGREAGGEGREEQEAGRKGGRDAGRQAGRANADGGE